MAFYMQIALPPYGADGSFAYIIDEGKEGRAVTRATHFCPLPLSGTLKDGYHVGPGPLQFFHL